LTKRRGEDKEGVGRIPSGRQGRERRRERKEKF